MSDIRQRYIRIAWYGVLFFTALYVFVPWLRKPLVRENNILELLQVMLYVTTALWGLWLFTKTRLTQARWVLGMIIFLSIVFVLEELSYGDTFLPIHRMLGDSAPRLYGIKIDALHDFIQVFTVGIVQEDVSVWMLVITGLLIVAVAGIIVWGRLYDPQTVIQACRQHPSLEFVLLCGGLLVFATLLDLEFVRHHSLMFLEEIIETLASLALLFSLFPMRANCQPDRSASSIS